MNAVSTRFGVFYLILSKVFLSLDWRIVRLQTRLLSVNTPDKDKYVADLARQFLTHYSRALTQLKPSISNQDSKAIADIAHRIKGTARLFGFDRMASLSEEIERHILRQNWNKIASLYGQLVKLIEKEKR